MQEFFSQFPLLKDEIDRYKKAGSTVILQASSLSSLQSLHKTLQEYDIQAEYINDKEIHKNSVQIIQGNLNQGFNFVDQKLVLITEFSKRKLKDV